MADDAPSWGPVPPTEIRTLLGSPRRAALEPNYATIRPRLRPIATWRLDVGRFEFESSFLSPQARDEITDLGALHRMFPDSPLSLFGHTDPTGDDAFNKALSGRRALALYGALVRDAELWEELWSQPLAGDEWGAHATGLMLGALPGEGSPGYYDGVPSAGWTASLTEAVAAYQQANPPLAIDGLLGPQTRAHLFAAYMQWLCTDDDGNTLQLGAGNFLARGADPQCRGDVQGCGEFNPRMVFSEAETVGYSAWDQKEARDKENSINRRVVAFLYPPDVKVEPGQWWPCPAARDGLTSCRERMWSDAARRRNPTERRRHFDGDYDTFACRFYHYFAQHTPSETPVTLGRSFVLYLHDSAETGALHGTFRLASRDGTAVFTMRDDEATLLRDIPGHRVRCLEFIQLPAGHTWALSLVGADPKTHKPIPLLESFTLEDFTARGMGHDPEHEAEPLEYAPPVVDPGGTVPPKDDLDWNALSADWRGANREETREVKR